MFNIVMVQLLIHFIKIIKKERKNMIIKEAFLQEEFLKIEKFLETFSLKLDNNLTKTFYIENDNSDVIGTISCQDYIIKDLAVDPNYQSENLASILVNEILNYFRLNNIHNYQVFTKPIYKQVFVSLGFKEIVKTDKVIMLEGGVTSINDKIKEIKNIITYRFGEINETSDIACIVMNANPITNGHVYLIEEASKNHKMVVLFIVEEDKSEFTFKERFSMAYLSTMRLGNVCVIPSSKYVVSQSTFPSYFLKNETEVSEQYSLIDALIFKEYFIKNLFIKKRYIGTETINKMVNYNNILKQVLEDKIVILERLKENEEVISASTVRKLLKEGKVEEALQYTPQETAFILRGLASEKYGIN